MEMTRTHRAFVLLATLAMACANPTDPDTAGAVGITEGNWMPTLGGNTVYAMQTGRWHRSDNLVWITGQMQIVTLGTGSCGVIGGLPFESIDGQEPSGSVGYWKNLNMAVTSLTVTVRPNSATLAFHAGTGGDSSPTVCPLKDGSIVYFSASYEAKP